MSNIFKKWKISLVIVGIVLGIGYLTTNGESNIENDYNDESINNSSSEVLLLSLDEKSLEYEDMESDYKELEYLESILNDKYFVLINRDNKLDKSYVPSNLKKSEAKFLEYVQDNNLESATSAAAKKCLMQQHKMVFH